MIATYHLDEFEILGTATERVEICFELMMLSCGTVDVVEAYTQRIFLTAKKDRGLARCGIG